MYSFIKWIFSMKPVFLIFTCRDKKILYVNKHNKTNIQQTQWNFTGTIHISKQNCGMLERGKRKAIERPGVYSSSDVSRYKALYEFNEFGEIFKIIL